MKKKLLTLSMMLLMTGLAIPSIAQMPNWTNAPSDRTFLCGIGDIEGQFHTWLHAFTAVGVCGDASVTNDFVSLVVNSPVPIEGSYVHTGANFGPQSYASSGNLQIGFDGTNTFCEFPLVGFTPGNIALIDRGGGIQFHVKARNAQNAGALGVIIVNNVGGDPVYMGADGLGGDIAIPIIMISLDDGNLLKSTMLSIPVQVTLQRNFLDLTCAASQSVVVNFTAKDLCSNTVSQAATFNVNLYEPPSWVVEPFDQTIVCNEYKNEAKFNWWLNGMTAIGNCGTGEVLNDFQSFRVNSPLEIDGPYKNSRAYFGPGSYNVTGDLERAIDTDGSTLCGKPLVGFTPGNIALIGRGGGIEFIVKVKHAQDAGAIGVLIVNNVDGDPVGMGGSDATITIPALMVSMGDGETLKTWIDFGPVNATLLRKAFDFTCTAPPQSIAVNFTALDNCGSIITKEATFTIIPNDPPVWALEPSDKTISCDQSSTLIEFDAWLRSFTATGTCGSTVVTNNMNSLVVNYPMNIAGSYSNSVALFGPEVFYLSAETEFAHDSENSYCNGPLVDFTPGKIAIIDRGGGSTFVTKVRNAEMAGATGVIICNNILDPLVQPMGDDFSVPQVTIPVMMISQSDGLKLKEQLAERDVAVTMTRNYIDNQCLSPNSIAVEFTATDECGNHVSKIATFQTTTMFSIEKVIMGADKKIEPEGTFSYNIRITNYSGEILTVHVEDSEFPTPWDITMLPGQGWAAGYNRTYTEVGQYFNTATATATDPDGNSLTKSASTVAEILPAFSIERVVDPPVQTEPGAFSIKVKIVNLSTEELDFEVTDTNGWNFTWTDMQPGDEQPLIYPEHHPEPGFFNNKVVAKATFPDGTTITKEASSTATVIDAMPSLSLIKTVEPASWCNRPEGQFNWKIEVKNTGPETVTGTIYDDNNPIFPMGLTMNPGQIITWNYTTNFANVAPDAELIMNNTTSVDVTDNDGNAAHYSSTATATVYALPKITEVELSAAEGDPGPPWTHPVNGNMAVGYEVCLDQDVPFYHFNIESLTSNYELMPNLMFEFRINTMSLPAGFYEYWDTERGVNAGVPWGEGVWQWYMYQIITAVDPMFYLLYDGTNYQLIDGLMFNINGTIVPLKVNGDYPSGVYTFDGYIRDIHGCFGDKVTMSINFKGFPSIITQPMSQVSCIGEAAALAVEAGGAITGHQWYKNNVAIDGATSAILLIDPVTAADAGDYFVMVLGECSDIKSDIVKLAVKEVIVNPNPQQYSDPVTFTAIVHNGNGLSLPYSQVTFLVETQKMGTVPLLIIGNDLIGVLKNAPLIEPDPGNGVMSPGIKTVQALFENSDEIPFGCIPEAKLEITPENARLAYDGVEFQATSSATSSTTTVQLIAVIKDWVDGYPGDIRNACITFRILEEPGGTLVRTVTLPVNRLIMPGDISTGIVSYDFDVNLGSADYKTYTIRMIADCYYQALRSATLTVYKPVGDFITGGGHIITNNSFGTRAGEPDTHTNFGFHVKFNKKNTNLIGGLNFIYSRMVGGELNEFQIKSNSMSGLGVNIANPEAKTAVFTTKANLTNLTTGNAVEGNLQLYVTLTDRGEPGANDAIGFTLWRMNNKGKPSILVYSSSWNGVKTLEQQLDGGNLVVHSGFGKVAELSDPIIAESVISDGLNDLKVYPNPSGGPVTFSFILEHSGMTTIDIYSSTGQVVQRAWEGYVKGGMSQVVDYEGNLANGLYFIQLRSGGQVKTTRLIISKIY